MNHEHNPLLSSPRSWHLTGWKAETKYRSASVEEQPGKSGVLPRAALPEGRQRAKPKPPPSWLVLCLPIDICLVLTLFPQVYSKVRMHLIEPRRQASGYVCECLSRLACYLRPTLNVDLGPRMDKKETASRAASSISPLPEAGMYSAVLPPCSWGDHTDPSSFTLLLTGIVT